MKTNEIPCGLFPPTTPPPELRKQSDGSFNYDEVSQWALLNHVNWYHISMYAATLGLSELDTVKLIACHLVIVNHGLTQDIMNRASISMPHVIIDKKPAPPGLREYLEKQLEHARGQVAMNLHSGFPEAADTWRPEVAKFENWLANL